MSISPRDRVMKPSDPLNVLSNLIGVLFANAVASRTVSMEDISLTLSMRMMASGGGSEPAGVDASFR